MDGKTHVSRSMRETYVFQNACITHVKKHTLNAWCSIYAFNVRFLRTFYVCFMYGKRTLHFLLCSSGSSRNSSSNSSSGSRRDNSISSRTSSKVLESTNEGSIPGTQYDSCCSKWCIHIIY